MSRKLLLLTPILGMLCMGQSQVDCEGTKPIVKRPVTLITDKREYVNPPAGESHIWFPASGYTPEDNRREHPEVFMSETNMRMMMLGGRANQMSTDRDGDILFSGKPAYPQQFIGHGPESLGTAVPANMHYGSWWSVPQRDLGIVDIEHELERLYYEDAQVTHVTFYDEGVCSLTLPWHTEHIDPFIADEYPGVVETLGDGLAATVASGWDEGLKGFTGRKQSDNEAWYADFITGIRRSEHETHGTRAYMTFQGMDWENPRDVKDRTDHEVCLRSYLLFNGRLEWKGDETWGEGFAWLLGGGWLPDLFGIGECPGERLTAVTICGEFEKATGGEEYLTMEGGDVGTAERLPVPYGSLVFKHSTITVRMDSWPRINVVCNNNKWKYEDGIRSAIEGTIDESFNKLIIEKLASEVPFSFKRVYMTPEGVTLVVADTTNDPNYGFANVAGLCNNQRPPQFDGLRSMHATMPHYTPVPFSWP